MRIDVKSVGYLRFGEVHLLAVMRADSGCPPPAAARISHPAALHTLSAPLTACRNR